MTIAVSEKTAARIIVAVREERLRVAATALLKNHHMNVEPVERANDILRVLCEEPSDILLLDIDMHVRDLISMVRVLQKNPQTKATGILVACPADIDKTDLKELVAAGVMAVLIKPLRQDVLLAKIQECLQRLAQRAPAHAPKGADHGAEHVPGNPSLLMRRIECPFHTDQKPFHHYTLRAGKVTSEMSFFDIPVYLEATPGATFVNYHLIAVVTCPVCGFSSNNLDHFIQPSRQSGSPRPFDTATVAAVYEEHASLQSLCPMPSESFYSEQRSLHDALAAYEMAIASSRLLYKCDPHIHAVELVRIGNYHLKMALLLEQNKVSATAIQRRYEYASETMKEAYTFTQGPAFYRNIYQLIATLIYLGDDKAANEYLGRLKDFEHDPSLPPPDRAAIVRYLALAQKAWEDRDFHRRPT